MQILFTTTFLYSILGTFSILCALAVLFFKKNKTRVHWFTIAALVLWGLRMGVYASLFYPTTCHLTWVWPTYITLSLAYGPVFFLAATELADVRGVTRNQYLVFIPMIVIATGLILVFTLCDPDNIQRIHDSAILGLGSFNADVPEEKILITGEYFCYYIFRSATFWLEAGIMIWSSWNITQYEKTVNEYFSSHEGKSIRQAKAIAILTAISVVAVIIREAFPNYNPQLSSIKLVLILVSFLFQVFLTIMMFQIKYTAYDIRVLLESDNNKVNYSDDNRNSAISTCWAKLQEMMKTDKVFLEPELNLIDLSQRLGTNRTYMSLAIKQFSGQSFSDYINNARIEYAKELLLNGEALKNVEYSCGYTSTSTFYRQFQRQVGMAPTSWLDEARRGKINK